MDYFIYQVNKSDCGFTALKMLLAITYKKEDYLYIPNYTIDNKNLTLFDLKNIASMYGANLEAKEVDSYDEINNNNPFLYVYQNENNQNHTILIKKKYKKYSYIYDPDGGKRFINNNKFFNDDKGIMLDIKSSNERGFNSKKLIEKSNLYLLLFFQILSILLIFIGMFLVDQSNEKQKLIFSVLFIASGLIISIIQKIYTFNMMDKFDQDFIRYTFDLDYKIRDKNYRLMHKTKIDLFTSKEKILINLLLVAFINIALFLNNFKCIYELIIILIINIIDIAYISKKIGNKDEINDIENKLLKENYKEEEYINLFNELKNKTYKIVKINEFKKLIYYSIIFVISFILFMFSSEHLISTLILYFFTGIISFNYINESLNSLDKNKSIDNDKTLFITLINNKSKDNKQN